MLLDTTTRKLQLVLTAAKTTTDMPVCVYFVDTSETAFPASGMSPTNSNGVSVVDILAAPLVLTQRKVNAITVNNIDTAAKTLKIYLDDNGTDYLLCAATLQVGDVLGYTDTDGWYTIDANGARKLANANYAIVAGTLAQFAATTSEQLAGVVSDETGTGGILVFNKAPVIEDGLDINLLATDNITIDARTNPRTITLGVLRLNHTAGVASTRAIHLDVDTNGFGDTHAVGINYVATGYTSSMSSRVLDIAIDTDAATGGDIHVLAVSKTGAGVLGNVYALEAYADVNPILQKTGTWANITQAWAVSGAAYTDVTSNLSSISSNATLFAANNDYLYIGDDNAFSQINVSLLTSASGAGVKPTFEFSAGSSVWTAFTPADGTNGFRQEGLIGFGTLSGWTADTVNSVSKKWIRIQRTQNTLTTVPVEKLIQIMAPTTYSWDKLGNVSVLTYNGNTITASSGTLTLAAGKTLTANNTITLTATDGSTLAIGTGGTLGTAAYIAASSKQDADATLTSLALLGTAADKIAYTTGVDTWAEATFTAAARTVLDDATVADMVNTLGGAASTGTGGLVRATSPVLTTPAINGTVTTTGLTLPAFAMGGAISNASNYAANFGTGALTAGTLAASGIAAFGAAVSASVAVNIENSVLSGSAQYGLTSQSTFTSGATTSGICFQARTITAAGSYTMTDGVAINVLSAIAGSGCTITSNTVLKIADQTAGANNYGITSQMTSAANKFFLNSTGTAASRHRGDFKIYGAGVLGYDTGSGGTVTQITSRTTGVTINKSNGEIVLVSAAGLATYQSVTVTNSLVSATFVPKV
ncbi:MAG: hypothetical protein WA277_06035, partial [Nitrospirota bacterium]